MGQFGLDHDAPFVDELQDAVACGVVAVDGHENGCVAEVCGRLDACDGDERARLRTDEHFENAAQGAVEEFVDSGDSIS